MASLTGADAIPYRWAEEYRMSDLETRMNPEVRFAVRGLGIEPISVAGWHAPKGRGRREGSRGLCRHVYAQGPQHLGTTGTFAPGEAALWCT